MTMTPQALTSVQHCSTLIELLPHRASEEPDLLVRAFPANADP